MCLNTSSEKIVLTIEKSDVGFVIYDETESFIDFVPGDDKEVVLRIVSSIVKDRIDGKQSSGIWEV